MTIAKIFGGGALTDEGISEMFRRFVQGRLGIECTAHRLRHSFATELRRRGTDLRVIQRQLGHGVVIFASGDRRVSQDLFATWADTPLP